ncbi:MAG: methylmalonyl-CoA mutase family protein [Planctomycetota bacterium]|nr:methylmalonyl-CoA mutase family protein [Planctomycetota bacterium]
MKGEDQPPTRWTQHCWEPFVSDHPERLARFQTSSGTPVDPLYCQDEESPGPGEFPFTRGIHPSMYRGRLWTMRQYAGYSSPQETNQRFRFLLAQGQTGLSVAFDLPTQIGYDSDDPEATGEVGRVGVPINTIDDLDQLLSEIPLESVSISMTINSTAPLLLALLLALAKRRGIAFDQIRGTLQNDILKEYIARGTQRFPVEPSMRLVVDVIEYCSKEVPSFYPISISGYHIREAGSTAIQEVAFTLANGIAYLNACRDRGLDLIQVGRRLSFFFNAHNQLFEEIAKFRAARRMWARICRERFQIEDDRACQLRFHTQTGGSTLQAKEPANNIVRVTIQALAAVLGGTQSLHTNSWDEALSLPSQEAARLALRTQQVLASESGVTDTSDPLGGAPFIEYLTNQIDDGAMAMISDIDERGGMLVSVNDGYIRRAIEQSAYEAQVTRDSGESTPVGVEEDGAIPEAPFRVDASIEQQRKQMLEKYRLQRDDSAVESALLRVEQSATGSDNMIPVLIDAMESGCTLGEVSRRLAAVFGESQDHG